MERWFAVQTQPRAEAKARFNLLRQGFTTYLPEILKRRSHARRVDMVRAPFFPRYLFVGFDPDITPWRAINSTIGVSGLVSLSDGAPTPVPDHVVDSIRAQEREDGLIAFDPTSRLKPGDKVRIGDGPFAEMGAIFEAVADSDRIAILLDLMGRAVRVKIARHHIAAP